MKTVGPFVAARPLDSLPRTGPPRPVEMLRALDRLTGLPVLVYLLPRAVALPELPDSPSLLPYSDMGVQRTQAYVACELPPHASLAADVMQAALGGLRALNALHEAGLVHGGVQPQQLWAWDGETRLAGALLPWGEAEGPYAAPEGGASPAADLYALGASLLRLGPMPSGLSDLLSPYPAQRPSARDALALLNAGPPLPPQRVPLLIQAPLHPPAPPAAKAAALPLIADPEERLAAKAQEPPERSAVQAGAGQIGAGPIGVGPDTAAPSQLAGEAQPPIDWAEVFPSELASKLEGLSQAEAEPGVEALPASAEPAPGEPVAIDTAPAPNAEPLATRPTPEQAETPAADAALPAAQPVTAPEASITYLSTSAPLVSLLKGRPAPAPAQSESAESEQPASVPLDSAPGQARGASAQPVQPLSSSARQLRQVRIGWSQDGSWQVKKDGSAASVQAERMDQSPPPFVRSPAPRPAVNPLNYWWIGIALLAALLLLILRLTFFADAVPASPCCTLAARVLGSAGQSLSAPLRVSLVSAPADSRLQAGTLIGQAPGSLSLDAPGGYDLRVEGDGYAPQTVAVSVPSTQPLVITLK